MILGPQGEPIPERRDDPKYRMEARQLAKTCCRLLLSELPNEGRQALLGKLSKLTGKSPLWFVRHRNDADAIYETLL
jgi:hypothetical protein